MHFLPKYYMDEPLAWLLQLIATWIMYSTKLHSLYSAMERGISWQFVEGVLWEITLTPKVLQIYFVEIYDFG